MSILRAVDEALGGLCDERSDSGFALPLLYLDKLESWRASRV